jgi:hypothetical protein
MNDLYGIDPTAPESIRDLSDLMRIFGPGEGRFIAEFPDQWFVDLSSHMKSLSDLQQMAAIELWLKIGRNAVLPTTVRFNSKWSWSENATALKDHVVKLIGNKRCPATLEPIDKVLIDPRAFRDARGGHIPRTADAYAAAARPLLQTSPKIVLVDPYFKLRYFDNRAGTFRPSTRHRNSLMALFREAAVWKRVECFKLAVSSDQAFDGDKTGAIFDDQLLQIRSQCGAQSIDMEVEVLDGSLSTDRHPRYLLGMHSGLHFDWGFDTGDVTSTNHIEWMGQSVLAPLLDRFT